MRKMIDYRGGVSSQSGLVKVDLACVIAPVGLEHGVVTLGGKPETRHDAIYK